MATLDAVKAIPPWVGGNARRLLQGYVVVTVHTDTKVDIMDTVVRPTCMILRYIELATAEKR
jgi:hypothetical protein